MLWHTLPQWLALCRLQTVHRRTRAVVGPGCSQQIEHPDDENRHMKKNYRTRSWPNLQECSTGIFSLAKLSGTWRKDMIVLTEECTMYVLTESQYRECSIKIYVVDSLLILSATCDSSYAFLFYTSLFVAPFPFLGNATRLPSPSTLSVTVLLAAPPVK